MSTNNNHGAGMIGEYQRGEAFISGRGTSVRLRLPDGTETGLCTFTYSYNMSQALKEAAARRFVAMWNACRGTE